MRLAPLVVIGVGIVGGPTLSSAAVTAVKGSAYGYSASVSLLGGEVMIKEATPTVTLPAGGSASPVTATAASGDVLFAPAHLFDSKKIDVSTQGTTGASGSVTSSATIENINDSGDEAFTAAKLVSTCTASETGVTGSTTITGGKLDTDLGADAPNEHDVVTVDVPANPAPNTKVAGHLHVSTTQDNFEYTFNEQVKNADGSLTVYAVHQKLLGPLGKGDVYMGKVECGVTADGAGGATPTTTAGATTTTKKAENATTTTQAGSATTTTQVGSSTTTSASPPTTEAPTSTSAPGVPSTTSSGSGDPNLPNTGSSGERLYNLALTLLLVGAALLWCADPLLRRPNAK